MINFEGINYYSSNEIRFSNLDYRIKRLCDSNKSSSKSKVYFNSTIQISNSNFYRNLFKKNIIRISGFFRVDFFDDDALDETYLNLYFTELSYVDGKKYYSEEPIKISKLNQILFNYINFPEIYSKMKVVINSNENDYIKTHRLFNLIPNYFCKQDLLAHLIKSQNKNALTDEIIKEINEWRPSRETFDRQFDWYESISSDKKHQIFKSINDTKFISLEALKSIFNKNKFMLLLKYLRQKHFIYINTKSNHIKVFERDRKTGDIIPDYLKLKGFISVSGKPSQSENNVAITLSEYCCINAKYFLDKQIITKSFEALLEYIEKKDNCIELNSTYFDIKKLIINQTILYAKDLYCYFKITDIESFCSLLAINFDINKLPTLSSQALVKKSEQQLQREAVLEEFMKINSIPVGSNFADEKYGRKTRAELWEDIEEFFLENESTELRKFSGKLFDSRNTNTINGFFRDAKLCIFDKRKLN